MQEVPTLWSTALLLLLDHDLGVLPVPLPLAPWSHRRKRSPWRWSRGYLGERPPSFHLFLPARVLSWVVRFGGGGGWRVPEDGSKAIVSSKSFAFSSSVLFNVSAKSLALLLESFSNFSSYYICIFFFTITINVTYISDLNLTSSYQRSIIYLTIQISNFSSLWLNIDPSHNL